METSVFQLSANKLGIKASPWGLDLAKLPVETGNELSVQWGHPITSKAVTGGKATKNRSGVVKMRVPAIHN